MNLRSVITTHPWVSPFRDWTGFSGCVRLRWAIRGEFLVTKVIDCNSGAKKQITPLVSFRTLVEVWTLLSHKVIRHTAILRINALHLSQPKCTHTAVNTHAMNTHPEQWAAINAAVPREQLEVRCLAQGHLSRGIEGGESAVHLLPPPTIPAGPRIELKTFRLPVQLSNH